MNYPESQLILDEIKKSNKILINCHTNPDADSVGSAYAMADALINIYKKEVLIICPDELPQNTLFITDSLKGKINFQVVDFDKFNFSDFELFLSLDASSWSRVRGGGNNNKLDIKTIVIDHHETNDSYGYINLVDKKISSTAELLYCIFEDWNLEYFPSESLLTGIISDTECFRTDVANSKTLEIASKLAKDSDKNKIISNLYHNNPISTLMSVGNILLNTKLDESKRFCYAYLNNDDYSKNKDEIMSKDLVADLFINSVIDTYFGFVAIEKTKGVLHVSFRSRGEFDTSVISSELGGGGHKNRSAVIMRNIIFDEALEKVLSVSRKYAK